MKDSLPLDESSIKRSMFEKSLFDKRFSVASGLNEGNISKVEDEIDLKIMQKITQIERHYFVSKVIPKLSKGIMKIATKMPDNPVEALADYLIEHA